MNMEPYNHLNLSFSLEEIDKRFEDILSKGTRLDQDEGAIRKIDERVFAKQLDQFFTGTHCKRFLLTAHDKPFFGIRVYPDMPPEETLRLATTAQVPNVAPICVNYNIELDAKIFDPMMYMLGREITAFVLYAVYYTMYESMLGGVNVELAKHCYDKGIDINSDYMTLAAKLCFAYGFNDAIMKNGNPLYILNGEYIKHDKFLSFIGYNYDMFNCLKKLYQNINMLHTYLDHTWYVLAWALRVISEYDQYRIPAYKTLLRAADLTGSILEKDQILKCAKALQKGDSMIIEGVETYENPDTIQTSSLGYLQLRTLKTEVHTILHQLDKDDLTTEQVLDIQQQVMNAITELEKMEHEKLNPKEYKEVWDCLQQYRGLLDHCYEKKVMTDHNGGKLPIIFVNF